MKNLVASKFVLVGMLMLGLIYFMIAFPNIFKFRNGVNTYDTGDVVLAYVGALFPALFLLALRLFISRISTQAERRAVLSRSEKYIFAIYIGIIALGGFRQIQNRPSMADIERRIQESKTSVGN